MGGSAGRVSKRASICSTRDVSSLTVRWSSATDAVLSMLVTPPSSSSHRDQAVLLGRAQLALGDQGLERLCHVPAGVGRLDDVVHQPALAPRRRGWRTCRGTRR